MKAAATVYKLLEELPEAWEDGPVVNATSVVYKLLENLPEEEDWGVAAKSLFQKAVSRARNVRTLGELQFRLRDMGYKIRRPWGEEEEDNDEDLDPDIMVLNVRNDWLGYRTVMISVEPQDGQNVDVVLRNVEGSYFNLHGYGFSLPSSDILPFLEDLHKAIMESEDMAEFSAKPSMKRWEGFRI